MEYYAGIDVSLESASLCIVDATGREGLVDGRQSATRLSRARADAHHTAASAIVFALPLASKPFSGSASFMLIPQRP